MSTDKFKISSPGEYQAKISFSLGLLGLVANILFYQLNDFFWPLSFLFSALLALSLGSWAAITSSVIAIIPLALWTDDITLGFRLVTALALFAHFKLIRRKLGIIASYILSSSAASLFTVWNHEWAVHINYISYEVLMVTLSALFLTSRTVFTQITNRTPQLNYQHLITNISTALFAICFLSTLGIVSFASKNLEINWTFMHASFVLLTLICSWGFNWLAPFLVTKIEQVLAQQLTRKTFSGLSGSNWRLTNRTSGYRTDSTATEPTSVNIPEQIGILALGPNNTVSFVNRSCRQLLQLNKIEVANSKINDLRLSPELTTGIINVCDLARSGKTKTVEIKLTNSTGENSYLELEAAPANKQLIASLDSGPGSVVITIRDVSSKRKLSSAVLQQQKLNTLAKNISGMVHDLNNHLTGVCGFISAARNSTDNLQRNEFLDTALKSAKQSAQVLKQLVEYAESDSRNYAKINVATLFDHSLPLLKQTLGPLAAIEFENNGDYHINCNREQMTHALLNIFTNIRDNYGQNETKQVRVNVDLEEFEQQLAELIPGGRSGKFARITIKDSATPLSATKMRQAFNALSGYKTSEPSSFDLSAAYSIIRAHDGFLLLENQKQQGNILTIYLPVSDTVSPNAERNNDTISSQHCVPHGHGEALLVVEDDSQVRTVICQMLSELGYHVKSCASGTEALVLCAEEKFALIVTDLMMPNMGGLEFAEHAEQIGQSKILMMTGYHMPDDNSELAYPLLPKPFDVSTLANSVRQALN